MENNHRQAYQAPVCEVLRYRSEGVLCDSSHLGIEGFDNIIW